MSSEAPAKKLDLPGLKSFLSGGFGGMCLVLVGHPFDLIKWVDSPAANPAKEPIAF